MKLFFEAKNDPSENRIGAIFYPKENHVDGNITNLTVVFFTFGFSIGINWGKK